MEKTKLLLGFSVQSIPVATGGLEKSECANDVGLYEVFRAMNGTVNVTLGGKIENGAGLVALSNDQRARIADITLYEDMTVIPTNAARFSRLPA